MRALFAAFGHTLPPLRGVVHAAGVVTNVAVTQLDAAALHAALRPKVTAGWLLHELTRERSLDFFVLFSAAAAVLGARGLAHYAAANEFLNALAAHRRHLGLPALAMAWGPWAGEGMAADEDTRWWLEQIGLQPLAPEDGLRVLARWMAGGAAQALAARVDWSAFRPAFAGPSGRRLLDEIEPPAAAAPAALDAGVRERLQSATADERRDFFAEHVAREAGRLLGFDAAERVDRHVGFFKAGMDSIMTVQLRNRLQATLGVTLPATVAFEYPTVDALAGYLGGVLAPNQDHAPEAPRPSKRASLLPEDLTEEELTALLAEKLRDTPAPPPPLDDVREAGS
jgi:acyl carrier protein